MKFQANVENVFVFVYTYINFNRHHRRVWVNNEIKYCFRSKILNRLDCYRENCSTEELNNTTTDCISQCIKSLYKSIDCAGYEKIMNLADIISNRNETMPALIPNEYKNVKGRMVSVVSSKYMKQLKKFGYKKIGFLDCDTQKGIKVYRRPNELIDFMNILRDIEQSNSELNRETLKKMIGLFEQLKSKFNQSNQWCLRSLGLVEQVRRKKMHTFYVTVCQFGFFFIQMKQIKQKANTSLEFEVTIVETSDRTTEYEPPNFTYVIETDRVHPREHHYKRSVWLILFISMLLMAILITISIVLRVFLIKNTQEPVQPKSMLNLIESN